MKTNTQAKHTPGPWYVTGSCQDGTMITDDTGDQIANWPSCPACRKMPNARLIAAAPELLVACENLIQACDCEDLNPTEAFGWYTKALLEARAAIAKATGKK